MAKSYKLKGDNYLDSSNVFYEHTSLEDILNQNSKSLTINQEYIDISNLSYVCFVLGKVVILYFGAIAFKKQIDNYVNIITGLPKPETYIVCSLNGIVSAEGSSCRLGITLNGELRTHWGSPAHYGDVANKQYSGIIVYKTK